MHMETKADTCLDVLSQLEIYKLNGMGMPALSRLIRQQCNGTKLKYVS